MHAWCSPQFTQILCSSSCWWSSMQQMIEMCCLFNKITRSLINIHILAARFTLYEKHKESEPSHVENEHHINNNNNNNNEIAQPPQRCIGQLMDGMHESAQQFFSFGGIKCNISILISIRMLCYIFISYLHFKCYSTALKERILRKKLFKFIWVDAIVTIRKKELAYIVWTTELKDVLNQNGNHVLFVLQSS